ncbi:putative non-specific lipid-transfer protein 14 [Telopea speciosissima]|uniref:putative non-specific lipid-transfer protein 14 n=1 Tax=Telopea speciosissima TaxID=54955 RepID=UPI001CC39539|nr:putative non-specific lipid-transfer protein 14 [Telopea speciosissima]
MKKSLNQEAWIMGTIAIMVSFLSLLDGRGTRDCSSVRAILTSCSNFIYNGTPDPMPGSQCCDVLVNLKNMAEFTSNNRELLCRCLMDLISTYNSNATAIATIPGFCGVSLGFTIDPNTDCNL